MRRFKLVKFFDHEKYAEEFLKGNLSMNYLGAYWGHDAQQPQVDKGNGTIKPQHITPAKYGQDDRYEVNVKSCAFQSAGFCGKTLKSAKTAKNAKTAT